MKRRVIIWTAMGLTLAVAPLAAEARQGRNGGARRMVLGCGENACVASTGAPTTAALLNQLTDLTTAAPTTEAEAPSTDATSGSTVPEPTTEPTSVVTEPSEPTTPSVPAGTEATQASTTSEATTPSETVSDTSAETVAEPTLPPTEPTEATLPPTPAPEPSVEPTPAPPEPTMPPTTVGTPPVGGAFLVSTSSPKVGVPVTFDVGDLTCDPVAACSYTWQWSFRSASGTIMTGGQMGRGQTVTYTFDDLAAAKPFVFVTLTVSQGRLGFRHTYTSTFVVTP